MFVYLLATRSEERRVLGVESTPVSILPTCQDMKLSHYNCTNVNNSWGVKIRNISEAVLRQQYSPWPSY